MEIEIYRVAAFTKDISGGNLAGVVLNADALTVDEMMKLAKAIGYSETAFVMKSTKADFRVRFFTPVDEVDLCGHATVATFNLLRDLGIVSIKAYTQETKVGILKIQVHERSIYMQQSRPQFYEVVGAEEIECCFKSSNRDYMGNLPIQIVSTGLKDILVEVKDLKTLLSLEAKSDMIKALSIKYDVVGIHAFCLETLSGCEAHARNFAPRYGIEEESATGTSNGALSCYLMKYRANDYSGSFTIEQGYCMNKPSEIVAKVTSDDDGIIDVYVGGSAYEINGIL